MAFTFATPKSTFYIETVDLEETGNSQKQRLAIAVPNEKSRQKEKRSHTQSETEQGDKSVSLRVADAKARGDKGFRLHAFAKHTLQPNSPFYPPRSLLTPHSAIDHDTSFVQQQVAHDAMFFVRLSKGPSFSSFPRFFFPNTLSN